MKNLFLLLSLMPYCFTLDARNTSFLTPLKDFFYGTQTDTETLKYTLTDKENHITIKNFTGDISIKTWDKKNDVLIETVKYGTEEDLQETRIDVKNSKNHLAIKTIEENTGSCSVDYSLIIPKRCSVHVETEKGNIAILNVNEKITAKTYKGSIKAIGGKNVQAETKYGNVDIETRELRKEDKILALSTKGNIKLTIPENTNATLYAKTERGKVTTEQKVSLNKVTTEINNRALANLRKDVNGSIGSTEGGEIRLLTSAGNVKVQNGARYAQAEMTRSTEKKVAVNNTKKTKTAGPLNIYNNEVKINRG